MLNDVVQLAINKLQDLGLLLHMSLDLGVDVAKSLPSFVSRWILSSQLELTILLLVEVITLGSARDVEHLLL